VLPFFSGSAGAGILMGEGGQLSVLPVFFKKMILIGKLQGFIFW
jgi:hypothetical protein